MNENRLVFASIAELSRRIRAGDLAPVELTRSYLDRIEALDGKLGAFRLVCPERALAAARQAESAASTDRGALHGIPFVAKDLFDVRGLPTTAGTRLMADNIATEDSEVVARLEAAGMILLGKTNTVQFAYGGTGVNNDHGTPRNPWCDEHRLPGGSSSGSAVAVAAGMAPAGLGTDTGGSVRVPASFCNLTGLKTTVGRIDRSGVYPLSFSLDSVGPLARTAEDAALLYENMQSTHRVMDDLRLGVRGMRLAFAEAVFWDDADAEVVDTVRATKRVFEEFGARVDSIEFPEAREALDLNPRGLVIASEAYTQNRRFLEEHFDELDPVVASRMIQGRETPAHEYLRAKLDREALAARTDATLREVDALLCPTVMIPPPPVAELLVDLDSYNRINLQCLRNTVIGNLLGLCGLSVPCGFTRDGLPVGLMIYGRAFHEQQVLRVGHAFQQATDWHLRAPE
jgi:aspartyl-tRNA(Asn)/glutamyl-tRNA(Gln) amidotransferase subunit A